jgi:hypothetical protein
MIIPREGIALGLTENSRASKMGHYLLFCPVHDERHRYQDALNRQILALEYVETKAALNAQSIVFIEGVRQSSAAQLQRDTVTHVRRS